MFLKLLISMAVALPFDPKGLSRTGYISRTGCPKFRHGWNSGAASRAPALAQRVPQAICSPGLSEIVRGLRKSSAAAESRISVGLDGPDASLPNGGHSASGLSR